jgi:hypothetical protein
MSIAESKLSSEVTYESREAWLEARDSAHGTKFVYELLAEIRAPHGPRGDSTWPAAC